MRPSTLRALRLRPDAILIERTVNGQPALPFLTRLRRDLPLTTFVMLANDFDAAELLEMEDIGVSGFTLCLKAARLESIC